MYVFFSPLYFSTIGLKANFFQDFDLQLVLIIVVFACIGKILGSSVGARLGGLRWNQALTIGLGLNARGAVEIIIASIALEAQVIDRRIYVSLVIMAIVTSIGSALGLKLIYRTPAVTILRPAASPHPLPLEE